MPAPNEGSRAQCPCVYHAANVFQRGQGVPAFLACPVSADVGVERPGNAERLKLELTLG